MRINSDAVGSTIIAALVLFIMLVADASLVEALLGYIAAFITAYGIMPYSRT